MSKVAVRGRFAWYDLMSSDPEGSKAFYTQLVGWTITPFEGAPEPYDMWTNEGSPIGGVAQLPAALQESGMPSHWLAYVAVPDMEETLAQCWELGGKVRIPATAIPNVGTYGVIEDPQGAATALYTSSGEVPGTDGPVPVGQMSWHELMTTDYEAAFNFYATLFGWQRDDQMDMGEAGIYQIFNNGGPPLGGILNKPPQVPVPCWLYYIRVNDADASAKKATALGAQITNGPMEVPGGDRIVVCTDPQGAAFALHSTAAR